MNRLASDRFLPNKLVNWSQKSHNVEIQTYDERNNNLVAQRNNKHGIFEGSNTSERRTKEDKFIHCETRSSYTEKVVPTIEHWQ